jgi:hypothetical protein
MGYFSNGTEGADYQYNYCEKCLNSDNPDTPGCAIWDLHLLYAYQLANSKSLAKKFELIPLTKNHSENLQCKLFKPKESR